MIGLRLEVMITPTEQQQRERERELHALDSIAKGIARIASVLERPKVRVPARLVGVVGPPVTEE